MLLMSYGLLNSQNISVNNTEKKLVTKTPLTQLKKTAGVAQKKEQQLAHGELYHKTTGKTTVTTWMGYSFKTRSTKTKTTF